MCTLNFILKEDTAEALRQAELKHLRTVLEGLTERPERQGWPVATQPDAMRRLADQFRQSGTYNNSLAQTAFEPESEDDFAERLVAWLSDKNRRYRAEFVRDWIFALDQAQIILPEPAPKPAGASDAVKLVLEIQKGLKDVGGKLMIIAGELTK